MLIDIYQSTKNRDKFISVPAGTDMPALKLPDTIDKDYLELRPFKTGLGLLPEQPRIALDGHQVIADIQKQGYALHGARVDCRVETEGLFRLE